MDWFWTWGGVSFGYRNGTSLVTFAGQEIGQFFGDEVYGRDGRYLGEVRDSRRLIRDLAKRGQTRRPFHPAPLKPLVNRQDLFALPMVQGYQDFPTPDRLTQTAVAAADSRDAA